MLYEVITPPLPPHCHSQNRISLLPSPRKIFCKCNRLMIRLAYYPNQLSTGGSFYKHDKQRIGKKFLTHATIRRRFSSYNWVQKITLKPNITLELTWILVITSYSIHYTKLYDILCNRWSAGKQIIHKTMKKENSLPAKGQQLRVV